MGVGVGIVAVMSLIVCLVGVGWSFVLVRLKRRQVEDAIEYEARLLRVEQAGMSVAMNASCDGDLGPPRDQKGGLSLCHDAGGLTAVDDDDMSDGPHGVRAWQENA